MAAVPNPPTGGATGGATTPTTPPAQPTNTGRAARAAGGIVSTLGRGIADWTTEETENAIGGIKDLLLWAIAIPVVAFTLGALTGRIGIWLGGSAEEWLIWIADGVIALGAFLGGILMTVLWTKLVVYGHAVGLAGLGLQAVVNALPRVQTQVVTEFRNGMERFLVWARGWTAWYIGALVYLMAVPIYRSLIMSMGAFLSLLLLAAILSAKFSDGPWARRALMAGALTVFIMFTLSLLFPGTSQAVRTWTGSMASGMISWGNRENRLATVERAAEEHENVQDAQLLDIKLARQSEIRERVIRESCTGAFCSDEDRAEYFRLDREVQALRAGTARRPTKSGGNAAPSKAPAARPGAAPVATTGSRLPPPPQVSRTPRSGSSPQPRAVSGNPNRRSGSHRSPAPAADDFGLGDFSQYPDL